MKSVLCTWLLKVTLHPCLWAVQVKQAILVKKYILPVTTLDFLPVQVYAQKSSRPSQQPPAAIWSTDKMQAGNAQLFPGWLTHFLQQHTGTCRALPRKAWFTGVAQVACTARAGDDAATYLLPGSPQRIAAETGRLPQTGHLLSITHFQELLGKRGQFRVGHWMSSQTLRCTTVTRSVCLRARTSLQFFSAFHLLTSVVNLRLHQLKHTFQKGIWAQLLLWQEGKISFVPWFVWIADHIHC